MAVPTGYNQRVFELSSRVSQLQQQLHFGRTLQAEQLQSRLEGLAARLVAVRCSFHSEFCLLAEELASLRKGLEVARRGCQIDVQAQQKQLSAIDKHLQEAFQEARHRGGESEARLLQAFDERSQLLREAIDGKSGLRHSAEELLRRFLEKEVPELRARLAEAAEHRAALQHRALERVSMELRQLRIAASEEVAAREKAEEALLQLCADFGSTLRADVELEQCASCDAEVGRGAPKRESRSRKKDNSEQQVPKPLRIQIRNPDPIEDPFANPVLI
ncbi:unnamed protein product [Durusdinium trenchii]|uniref:Uncharacterized protein n=2 Tax=Durusdinium trenchii TaxID=1381693 RepID=A0ABP0J3A9_9DINO